MPIMLRKIPAPKYKAKASMVPMAAAKSKAVETDGNRTLAPTSFKVSPCS